MEYRSKDGDVVDRIAFKAGDGRLSAEAIYDANPGLAALGPVLPSGVMITLPALPVDAPKATRPVRLWGKA